MAEDLNELRDRIHAANIKWWQDPRTGKPLATDEERANVVEALIDPKRVIGTGEDAYIVMSLEQRDMIAFMLRTRSRNKGELLMLMVSEIAEAMEGVRKNLPDSHLPEFRMEDVELADLIIRVLDYAGGFGIDLQAPFDAKNRYNATRHDHTHAARLAPGGKEF